MYFMRETRNELATVAGSMYAYFQPLDSYKLPTIISGTSPSQDVMQRSITTPYTTLKSMPS